MNNHWDLTLLSPQETALASQLDECNTILARFGLSLSTVQVDHLLKLRSETLRDLERIEFGESILKQLLLVFCDSPYISQDNLEETVAELQYLFYHFKNESKERFSDDELIELMKTLFDGKAQGSIDYLADLLTQHGSGEVE